MEDKKKFILRFAIGEAFGDATQQRALVVDKKKDIKEACIDINGNIFKSINNYIDGLPYDNQEEHDKVFYATTKAVVDEINKEQFVFGNAQKLLNMTIKYLYMSVFTHEEDCKKYVFCHCPMDSIMTKRVFGETLKDEDIYSYSKHKTIKSLCESIRWSKIKYCSKEVPQIEENGLDAKKEDDDIYWYVRFQKEVRVLAKKEELQSSIVYDIKHFKDD